MFFKYVTHFKCQTDLSIRTIMNLFINRKSIPSPYFLYPTIELFGAETNFSWILTMSMWFVTHYSVWAKASFYLLNDHSKIIAEQFYRYCINESQAETMSVSCISSFPLSTNLFADATYAYVASRCRRTSIYRRYFQLLLPIFL